MSRIKLTKPQIIMQLISSKNFNSGGIGRVDKARALEEMDAATLTSICRSLGCQLWDIGTDFVVAKVGVSVSKLV